MDDWEPPAPSRPRGRPSTAVVFLSILVLIGFGSAAYFYFRGSSPPAPSAASAPPSDAPLASPPPAPAAPEAPSTPLPAVDGETLLRKLVSSWSSAPLVAKWLTAESLVQRLAASVQLVSAGQSPRSVLSFVELEGRFEVDEVGDTIAMSQRSYIRYAPLVAALNSIDPMKAGLGYAQLGPYFDSIFRQVAEPGQRFDQVLVAALERLIQVKRPEGPVLLRPRGAIYLYADASLEALSPVEKQLLRLGPEQMTSVQTWLRRFEAAAGLAR